MIDVGCEYYVGDEDCYKCLKKGLLFHCEGCEFVSTHKGLTITNVSPDEMCDLMCGNAEEGEQK